MMNRLYYNFFNIKNNKTYFNIIIYNRFMNSEEIADYFKGKKIQPEKAV